MPKWKKNLYILWFTQVISLISFGFGLPFIPFFIEELGVTDAVSLKLYTGILSTAPAVSMAIMAPVWGMLADKYGRKLMILRAMFTAAFIIGGMGLVNNVNTLIILRGAQGFFTGTVTAASAFVAANTPKNRLSFALGFMSSSTFIGYSIGPALGGVVAKYAGYRASFFVGGVLMLIGALLVLFFIEENSAEQVEEMAEVAVKSSKKVITPLILAFLVILFFQRFARTVFMPYLPLFIKQIKGPENATLLTGFVNLSIGLATAISGLTLTRLGDKYSKSRLIMLFLAICVVSSSVVAFSRSLLSFAVTYTFLFLILGGIEPLATAYMTELTPSAVRGRLFGIQGMVGSLGWMISPMTGSAISIKYGYSAILWTLPIAIGINFMISLYVYRRA